MAVSVRGKDMSVVLTQKSIPVCTIESNMNVIKVEGLYAIANAQSQVIRVHAEAIEFRYKYGYEINPEALACCIANISQVYTQRAAMHLLGICKCTWHVLSIVIRVYSSDILYHNIY